MNSAQLDVLANAIIPENVRIGQPHRKSKLFDDAESLHRIGGVNKINGISVFWDESSILGIEIHYKIGKTAVGDYLNSAHNKPTKINSSKNHGALFEIGPDDYLLEVNARMSDDGEKIFGIGFTTYKAKKGFFGGEKVSNNQITIAHKFIDHTFGSVSGGFRDTIDFLNFSVVPVPAEFLKGFKPVVLNFNVNDRQMVTAKITQHIPGVSGDNNNAGGGRLSTLPNNNQVTAPTNFMQISVPKIPQRFNSNPVTSQPVNQSQQSYNQQPFNQHQQPFNQPQQPFNQGFNQPQQPFNQGLSQPQQQYAQNYNYPNNFAPQMTPMGNQNPHTYPQSAGNATIPQGLVYQNNSFGFNPNNQSQQQHVNQLISKEVSDDMKSSKYPTMKK